MSQTQDFVVRVEGFADSYGLGTEVAPGCVLFKADDYHLTKEELTRRIAAGKGKEKAQSLSR